ncbi:MAG: efflux RND transporter periplasmic adaptor subunit [Armatimonadota bacterium]
MMWKRIGIIVAVVAVLAGGIWFFRQRAAAKEAAAQPAVETATVERKDLTVSVSASGVVEALTKVEVKSRGGGEIKRLFVDAGDTVKAGQLIAQIDPTQFKTRVDQASATVAGGRARATQARIDSALQQIQTSTDITKSQAAVEASRANLAQLGEQLRQDREISASTMAQAEASLAASKARLAQAIAQRDAEPELQQASVASAKAALESARQNLAKVRTGARPQEVAEAEAALRNAEAAVTNAQGTLARQRGLLAKGFVSQQAVDDAQRAYDQSVAQRQMSAETLSLIKAGNRSEDIASAEAQVASAEAGLRQSMANNVQISLRQRDVEAAQEAVKQGIASVASAKAQQRNITVREKQIAAGKASLRQAESALVAAQGGKLTDASKRAGVQVALADLRKSTLQFNEAANELSYTNVYAPRAGVVMEKLAEEGSVIPAGTAALKEGAGLVSLADISTMFVLADVDETDMAGVKIGQSCDITVSVLPDKKMKGHVVKIFPLGVEDQSVVQFKVRIKIDNPPASIRPGMTADATITVAQVKDALVVPDVTITRSKGKSTVEVQTGATTEEREVVAGLSNWDDTEIKSGLKDGDKVIIPPPPGSPSPFGGSSKAGNDTGGKAGDKGKAGQSASEKARDAERTKSRMMMQFRGRQGGGR